MSNVTDQQNISELSNETLTQLINTLTTRIEQQQEYYDRRLDKAIQANNEEHQMMMEEHREITDQLQNLSEAKSFMWGAVSALAVMCSGLGVLFLSQAIF